MVTTRDRQDLRQELVSRGYSWEYVDEWQPKVTLYRHAALLNASGEEIKPAGTAVKGLPGNPDYALKKSRLGMLPFPPSDTCSCRWCGNNETEDVKVETSEPEFKPSTRTLASALCPDCSFKVTAATQSGAASKMRAHVKTHS